MFDILYIVDKLIAVVVYEFAHSPILSLSVSRSLAVEHVVLTCFSSRAICGRETVCMRPHSEGQSPPSFFGPVSMRAFGPIPKRDKTFMNYGASSNFSFSFANAVAPFV